MTLTPYYATHSAAQNRNEANAIVHHINDLTAGSGDNRSWDATRAHLNALAGGVLTGPDVEITTAALHPQIVSLDSVSTMVMIGSHTRFIDQLPEIAKPMG